MYDLHHKVMVFVSFNSDASHFRFVHNNVKRKMKQSYISAVIPCMSGKFGLVLRYENVGRWSVFANKKLRRIL